MEAFKGLRHVGWILLVCAGVASGYSTGALVSSCYNLFPAHDKTDAQKSEAPYSIQLSQPQYEPGDTITVILQSSPGHVFRGIVVRATRVTGDTEEMVGEFTYAPEDQTKMMKWYPQEKDYLGNCVTHTTKAEKENVTLMWRSPEMESLGDVVFTATFLESFSVFWTHVKSEVVRALQPAPASTFNSFVSLEFGDTSISDGCGETKGCLLWPRYCSGSTCSHIVTFTPHEDSIHFEVKSKTDGYVSVGFSRDLTMGDDETVSCLMSGEFVSVQHGYSPAYYNGPERITGFTNIETVRDGDYLYCRWTMPYTHTFTQADYTVQPPTFTPSSFDLQNEQYYMQLAYGHVAYGGNKVGHHTELPLVSADKVNLQQTTIVSANCLPLHVKIHAILGVTAWMLLASSAIFSARFFRSDVLSKKMCKLPAWFQLHRWLSVVTGLLTAAAITVMFAYIQKILEQSLVHCIVALIMMGLVIIQMIAGLCRPGIDHKNRAVFNWMHRIGGITSFMLAGATLLLSTYIPTLNSQLASNLFIIFIMWMAVQVITFILLSMLDQCTESKVYDMDKKSGLEMEEGESTGGNSRMKTLILLLFCLCNVTLTVAADVLIAIY